MATYLELQQRIASEIHRTDLTTQIQRAILSAIAHYESMRFVSSEKRDTFSTIAGERFYSTSTASPGTLPDDIVEIDSLVTTVNGRTYQLDQASYDELEAIDAGVTPLSGYPRLWAWYADQIRLYPAPNDEYVMTLSYQYERAALSADGDTNFWTTEAEELIRSRAKKDLALSLLKDPGIAQAASAMEESALRALKRRTSKLIGGGRIQPTPF